MRRTTVLALLVIAGAACSAAPQTAPDTDSTPGVDAAASRDVATDAGAGADGDAAAPPALVPTRVEILAPGTIRTDRFPVVVRVFSGDALAVHVSGTADVTVEEDPSTLGAAPRVYRGAGSADMTVAVGGSPVVLVARFDDRAARHELRPPTADRRLDAETITEDTVWGPGERIVVPFDVHVARGATLTIREGTTLRLAGNLVVDGTLRVEGNADAPVWFGPFEDPWGGVELRGGEHDVRYALFSGGGADAARAFGHSGSQPVLFVDGGALTLDHVALVDNAGKALGARDARLSLADSVISRCDTGGELERTALTMTRTHVLEMPDASPTRIDDDNDGIYLLGFAEDEDGPITSAITDSVFAVGKDDGIDHNGAHVRVDGCFIEGFHNEGVAASSEGAIAVVNTLVRDCDQGIEAGYGAPAVTVEHSVVTGNGVGLRYGDSYDWEVTGTLTVRDSIAVGNREHAVWNHVNALGGPRDGAVRIETSMVGDEAWDGRDGNVPGQPVFDATWHLEDDSPGRGAASDGGDVGLR